MARSKRDLFLERAEKLAERVIADFYAECRPLLQDDTWDRKRGDSVEIDLVEWLERRRD